MKIIKKELLSVTDTVLNFIVELPIFDCEPIFHDFIGLYSPKEVIPILSDYILLTNNHVSKLTLEEINCINRNWDFCINNRLDSWGFRYD